MVFGSFGPVFSKHRVYHGIIDFFILVALAMAVIAPIVVLILAVFITVVSLIFSLSGYKTGYIGVAFSVCKNE